MAAIWLAGEFGRAPIVPNLIRRHEFSPTARRRHLAHERSSRNGRRPEFSRTGRAPRGVSRVVAEDRTAPVDPMRILFPEDFAPRHPRWNPNDQRPHFDA